MYMYSREAVQLDSATVNLFDLVSPVVAKRDGASLLQLLDVGCICMIHDES